MKKASRGAVFEELAVALFKLYIAEHGGAKNQPHLIILWTTGRVEEMIKWAKEEEAKLMQESQNER